MCAESFFWFDRVSFIWELSFVTGRDMIRQTIIASFELLWFLLLLIFDLVYELLEYQLRDNRRSPKSVHQSTGVLTIKTSIQMLYNMRFGEVGRGRDTGSLHSFSQSSVCVCVSVSLSVCLSVYMLHSECTLQCFFFLFSPWLFCCITPFSK